MARDKLCLIRSYIYKLLSPATVFCRLIFVFSSYINNCAQSLLKNADFAFFTLETLDVIDQNFVPMLRPMHGCKFYASPPTMASILFFDVISDKAY